MFGKAWPLACLAVLSIVSGACSTGDSRAAKETAIKQGDSLFEAKEYAKAVQAYRQAVAADPRDGHARFKLSQAHLYAGQWGPAALEAIRAADLLPDDVDAQLGAGRMMLLQGRFVDVTARMQKLLVKTGDDARVLVLLGNAQGRVISSEWALDKLRASIRDQDEYAGACRLLRPGIGRADDRAAEDTLRKAMKIAPTDFETRLALVNLLWAAGRADEGESLLRGIADQFPNHPIANHALGNLYLARGRNADAEPYLKNAASAGAPYNREPRLALVDFYLRSNRAADAMAILQKMTAEDDQAGAVSLRRADTEIRLGQYDSALQRLDLFLAGEPKSVHALTLKSRVLLQTQKASEALAIARAAVASDSKSSDAHAAVGQAASAMGDVETAFNEFAEALRLAPAAAAFPATLARLALATGRDREALDYARQAARQDPDDAEVGAMMVKALVRLRDYGAANFAMKPLLEQHPERSDVQAQWGALLAERGDASGARAAFERALKSDPLLFDALEGLVSLDLEQQQLADARKRVDQAVAARPNDPTFLQLGSRVFRAEGDLQRAETALRRALDLEPGNIRAALSLAEVLSDQKKHSDAVQLLESVVARQPSSIPAQTALAVQLEQMGRTAEARTRYRRIVLEEPGATTAAARLVYIAVAQGENLDVPLTIITEAKRRSPVDPEVSDALGWLYLNRNIALLAIPQFEYAVRRSPRNGVYQYHLGLAYARAGRTDKARQSLTAALAVDSDFPDRPKAQAELAALPK
jgi:tetratricopeptide (TPR) repeat protein